MKKLALPPLKSVDETQLFNIMQETYTNRYHDHFWNDFKKSLDLANIDHLNYVADYGCGSGRFLIDLYQKFGFTQAFGIDISQTALNHLNEITTKNKLPITAVKIDLEKELPIFEEHVKFDLVFSGFAFHQLQYPLDTALHWHSILKEHGILIIYDWLRVPLESFLVYDGKRPPSVIEPLRQAIYRFRRFSIYSLQDLMHLLEICGFTTLYTHKCDTYRGFLCAQKKSSD